MDTYRLKTEHKSQKKGIPMPAASVQYQPTREMTIDELLLENRVVFMMGRSTRPPRPG